MASKSSQVLLAMLPALAPEAKAVAARRIATSGGTDDAVALAASPACPPEVLDELARHGRAKVRATVAAHPRLNPGTRETLRRDRAVSVARAAASNGGAPWAAFIGCYNPVRAGELAEEIARADTSPYLAQALRDDRQWLAHPEVVQALIAHHEDLLPDVLSGLTPEEAGEFARHELPLGVLSDIVLDGATYDQYEAVARCASATRWLTAHSLQAALGRQDWRQDWRAAQVIAAHPDTPVSVVRALVADRDRDVALQALHHPAAHWTWLSAVRTLADDEIELAQLPLWSDPEQLGEAVRAGNSVALCGVLRGQLQTGGSPEDVVAGALASKNWRVMAWAAGWSQLPWQAQALLATEGDSRVLDALEMRSDLTVETIIALAKRRMPWRHLDRLSDDEILLLPWSAVAQALEQGAGRSAPRLLNAVSAAFGATIAEDGAAAETWRVLSDHFEGSLGDLARSIHLV